jgi:phosphatidylglycerophosphatase A
MPAMTAPRTATLIASVGGIGRIPAMPGTWGSAAAAVAAYGLQEIGGVPLLAMATLAVFILGLWASGVCVAGADQANKDPGWIVIDEVAGQWLVLLVVPPDYNLFALGFVLFRIADIWKPWPASWADRALTGGAGVMVDDMFAALWAAVVLVVIRYAWFL